MRIKLAVAVAVAFLVIGIGTAEAFPVSHPGIGEHIAEVRTLRLLREYPGWRYRNVGYVDCGNGRINSYTWACAVGWASPSHCKQGRIRITNTLSEEGVISYDVNSVIVPCREL